MTKTLHFIVVIVLFSVFTNYALAEQDKDLSPPINDPVQEKGHDDHQNHHDKKDENHADDERDPSGHGKKQSHEDNASGVTISFEQAVLANITVAELKPQKMDYQVYAPGEIKENGYSSYLVSPRVDSVVLHRHVALGDHVKKGQALITLFSESVAVAQAAYKVAYAEWQRVQKLGEKTVAGKRFISAKSNHEAAYARLLAYGLSKSAIQSLIKKSLGLGEYTLIAVNAGSVLSDDFNQGQRVTAGDALMSLADEEELWVEAKLAPNLQLELPAGTKAQVKVGHDFYTATVSQAAHTIDPKTRTRVVRMLINNQAHRLHPGLFADVYFSFASTEPVLAVPETALMRGADGDWTVFVEHESNQFKAIEVELGRSFGKWREVKGIEAGSRVVMSGAFFVAAEIAKGGFDPHGH
ncbi:MAG: efflux transporter periplasmic adaptor subunit [Gammaproteobacteria bacterium]|nr:MAG: efflux transporter periplasmic adaptor subunit [Gammaproteobacteria bacterium]